MFPSLLGFLFQFPASNLTQRRTGRAIAKRFWRRIALALAGVTLAIAVAVGPPAPAVGTPAVGTPAVGTPTRRPALAQGVSPSRVSPLNPDVWEAVYERMPELPRENRYRSQETGAIDPDHTLVSRLVRYHAYIRGRPTTLRLDWKLTLADYLRANQVIIAASYPGADTLTENPLNGDRAAIAQLDRAQREQLVGILVELYSGGRRPAAGEGVGSGDPDGTPGRAPRPGDAQQLLPVE